MGVTRRKNPQPWFEGSWVSSKHIPRTKSEPEKGNSDQNWRQLGERAISGFSMGKMKKRGGTTGILDDESGKRQSSPYLLEALSKAGHVVAKLGGADGRKKRDRTYNGEEKKHQTKISNGVGCGDANTNGCPVTLQNLWMDWGGTEERIGFKKKGEGQTKTYMGKSETT